MFRLQRIALFLVAASIGMFAQTAPSKSPDEVLVDRAMWAIVDGKFDVANLALHTLLNTYPDSIYFVEAAELLKDPRVAMCDGSQFTTRTCNSSNRSTTDDWHKTWIEEALRAADTVKVGMIRADLAKVFTTEGGLSSFSQQTYVYRRCPYIKVDVKFETQRHQEHGEDKIVSISRPYLAWSVAD